MTILSNEVVNIVLESGSILLNYRDLYLFSKYKFYVVQERGQSKYVIANDKTKNTTRSLHNLIMNPPEGMEVDHINRDGLDNRRQNLRIVTHCENQNNLPKRKDSTSKYHGVYFENKRSKWVTYVNFNGIRKTIGRFNSEIQAAIAYNNAIIKMGINKSHNIIEPVQYRSKILSREKYTGKKAELILNGQTAHSD